MKPLHKLVRKNIWELTPYSSARDEYSGCEARVFLDANENPYNSPINRYPDPLQRKLKAELSKIKGVSPECMFLGNGSDEAIDLLYRIFCNPGIDNVVAIEPTYGMYKVCADINNVEYRPVSLNSHFQIDALQLLAATDRNTKLIWICSPNNPTGNCINRETIILLLENFGGIVVVDEAYSDFSSETPFRRHLSSYPNLVVLNTMSKAWGCAAIRLGMAFASEEIITLFNKVKYPYNVNQLTQNEALQMLNDVVQIEKWVNLILAERERMIDAFKLLPICQQTYPTEANFFLAKMTDANAIYQYLIDKGIVVRNRNSVTLCRDCLRITIGMKSENQELLAALRCYK
nr:histidinol-phosphate transaminase [uncultured Prevotella sp.]